MQTEVKVKYVSSSQGEFIVTLPDGSTMRLCGKLLENGRVEAALDGKRIAANVHVAGDTLTVFPSGDDTKRKSILVVVYLLLVIKINICSSLMQDTRTRFLHRAPHCVLQVEGVVNRQ